MGQYLWEIADDCPERLIGEYDKKRSPDRFLYKLAEKVDSAPAKPIFRFAIPSDELLGLDDLPNNALVPLVSERLGRSISSLCPDEVQLIDAVVLAEDREVAGYKVVNALCKVRSIDHQESKYTTISGTDAIMGFRRLRMIAGSLEGRSIAREEESMSQLVIGESLAQLLRGFNVEGTGIYLPEEMRW
jgi:hypothetical protein